MPLNTLNNVIGCDIISSLVANTQTQQQARLHELDWVFATKLEMTSHPMPLFSVLKGHNSAYNQLIFILLGGLR